MRGQVLAALIAAAAPIAAAPVAADPGAMPVLVPGAESFTLTASGTGHGYRIYLARPADPAPEAGFPVLYFLDGNATFATAAEAMRLQTRPPKGREGAVVVAIGTDGAAPFDSTQRYRDFTTPADPAALPKRLGITEVGGADAFLDFIARDLMPEIARRLPVDPTRATLVGHSLGGFFTLHAFLTRPALFSTYVAGSPSVWWNDDEIVARAAAFAADPPDLAGRRLFIGVGADELPDMVADAGHIAAILAPLADRDFAISHESFAHEEHVSVLPVLVSRSLGLSLAWRPLVP